eukprot:scaffold23925_cov157-Cylindrotheca_fusiformis.AAC.6
MNQQKSNSGEDDSQASKQDNWLQLANSTATNCKSSVEGGNRIVDGASTTVSRVFDPCDGRDHDPSSIDMLIARDMATSSKEELERANYDVHCISDGYTEETPSLIETSLVEFDRLVRELDENQALLQAESIDRDYVQNPDYRLMFLRADRFDIKAAAIRFVKHFQIKLELFGAEKLTVDITQDDLDSDSMEALYSCTTQVSPLPDRGGRPIVICNANGIQRSFDPKTTVRTLTMKSDTMNHSHISTQLNYNDSFEKYSIMEWLLFRGSFEDCLLSLKGYGIQPSFLPTILTNSFDRKPYIQWLEEQRREERRTKQRRTRIYVPGIFDVLFGKGSPLQNHVGNVKLRGLIADCRLKYEKAEKGKKHLVTRAVVETVKESSGLFLKQDGGAWVAVDDRQAELKVATLFRSLRDGKKAKAQN